MLTYALLAADDGRELPRAATDRLERLDLRHLVHRPDREFSVRSEDDRIRLRGWQTTDPATGWQQWRQAPAGLAALTGWAWPVDDRGVDLDWLEEVAAGKVPVRSAVGGFSGAFSVVAVDTERGRAGVAADPMGSALVYIAEAAGYLVVSSRADVAAALAGASPIPERDDTAMAWMPALNYFADDRTSYRGVRVLPPSASVEVDGHGWRILEPPAPWHDLADAPDLDTAADRLVRLMRSAARHPAAEPRFLLSGGRDSRLLLAAAVEAGSLDAFQIATFGDERHPDVVAARRVCAHLGVPHRRLDPPTHRLTAGSFARRAAEHVGLTSGMFGLWDLKERHATWNLRVTGLGGGAVHAIYAPLSGPAGDVERLTDELLGRLHFDAGGLLRAHVREELRRRATGWVERQLTAGADPRSLADLFFLEFHGRRWAGAAQEANTFGAQLSGLVDAEVVRACMAQPVADRSSGWLSLQLLRTLRPDLARLPLADHGWGEECVRRLPEVDVAPVTVPSASPVDWHDTQWPVIAPVFRERLLTETNPRLHRLIDEAALESVLSRHDRLRMYEKVQLWSTLGAAIWLGGADHRVTYPVDGPPATSVTERLEQELAAQTAALTTATARGEALSEALTTVRSRKVVRLGLAVADAVGRVRRRRR